MNLAHTKTFLKIAHNVFGFTHSKIKYGPKQKTPPPKQKTPPPKQKTPSPKQKTPPLRLPKTRPPRPKTRTKRATRPRTDCCCLTKSQSPCRLFINAGDRNLDRKFCWIHRTKQHYRGKSSRGGKGCGKRHVVYDRCK